MAIKPLSNTVSLSAATSVFSATAVYCVNDTTARVITIANTGINTGDGQHGDYTGGQVQIPLQPNGVLVIRKRPKDTVISAPTTGTILATKVTEAGT